MNFLDVLNADHRGKVRVEIDLAHSKIQYKKDQPVRIELWVRLLLGAPQMIGNELVFPVDLQGVGTYNRRMDGNMANGQIGRTLLRQALESAWRGSSMLLEAKPTTALGFEGMRLADSGKLVNILELWSKAR